MSLHVGTMLFHCWSNNVDVEAFHIETIVPARLYGSNMMNDAIYGLR